jgi:RNA polymerase sigma-70 factor (ECF subfamily)
MQTPSDAELIAQAVDRGSEDAFRLLYRRHSPRLYQLHLRLAGGDVADAEDLLQETWIRAARLLRSFRRLEPLPPWLRGVGVNVAREWLRRKRREEGRMSGTDPDDLATAIEVPAGFVDLEAAIAALPAGYRAVLVLHDVEGFTHAEIARQLGLAVGTSKSQLFAARRAVRHRLERNQEPEDTHVQS